jgi:hypothetical protein
MACRNGDTARIAIVINGIPFRAGVDNDNAKAKQQEEKEDALDESSIAVK